MNGGEITISTQTRLLAVLGHPVGHSLSPALHNAALRAQGVDAVYLAFDVLPEVFSQALAGLRALEFWGANVTLPHKLQAVRLVDELDKQAARVGAVNTIVNREGRLSGYNTDVAGFTAALGVVRPQGAGGARCLVFGAGGAARAVVAALVAGGAATIDLVNRTRTNAEILCKDALKWGEASCEVVDAASLSEKMAAADIVVNATSVGLAGTVKESAVPVDILDSRHVVVDLVYGPRPTYLVTEAIARGAAAVDGLEMLVGQAASSYTLWTGREAPVDVMRAAIERSGG